VAVSLILCFRGLQTRRWQISKTSLS